jgi:septum formation protein
MAAADPSALLILASRSPRRAQLLHEAGFHFHQADPPFHDPPQPIANGLSPQGLAMELAREKAMSLRGHVELAEEGMILAADTLCVDGEGRLLGQPPDREAAKAMIASFVERAHEVVSAVALLGPGSQEPTCFADTAVVVFGEVTEGQLESYLRGEQWRGKAGGYNLFDRQAAGWPIRVEGDPTTVVGLPMRRLVPALAERGIFPGKVAVWPGASAGEA